MTAADKLRELLATRPAGPNAEELVRWWRTSAPLITEALNDAQQLRDDLMAERGKLRREQDARAQLRIDLDRAKREKAGSVEATHPESWLDCPECKSLSKAGAEPPRCAAFVANERPAAPVRHGCANLSPPWFAGRWRDWHRGHGCDMDDGKPRTPEGKAEIERGGRG